MAEIYKLLAHTLSFPVISDRGTTPKWAATTVMSGANLGRMPFCALDVPESHS